MSLKSSEVLSIVPHLYNGTDACNILELYCSQLRTIGGRNNMLHANMLEHYIQISEDREFISSLQMLMSTFFFNYLDSYHQSQVLGRKKALISLEDKCNLLLAKKKPPEVHDNLGFRIILLGETPEQLVADCYSVMDCCIDFFITNGFSPTKAEQRASISNFDSADHPTVFVPEKSLLRSENRIFVKDYILKPKDKGYQSLHVIFVDSLGREVEVQIRSFYMDQYAESGPASHTFYKSSRYKDDENNEILEDNESFAKVEISQIDINKILSPKFIVTGDENTPYYDKAGIFEYRVFFDISNI